jgi:hypothetical protein
LRTTVRIADKRGQLGIAGAEAVSDLAPGLPRHLGLGLDKRGPNRRRYQLCRRFRHQGERIAHKMDPTALPPGSIQHRGKAPLTLPFHTGRVAQPNQQVTVNGGTVTLKKAVLTPSELRIYLAGVGDFFIAHLSTGNVFDGWDSEGDAVGTVNMWTTSAGLSAVSYPAALYQRHGEWTLQVRLAGGGQAQSFHGTPTPVPTGGPWTFHFVIP